MNAAAVLHPMQARRVRRWRVGADHNPTPAQLARWADEARRLADRRAEVRPGADRRQA